MGLPGSSRYVIIGAGVHGLSVAYHLALALSDSRQGSGRDIVVLDKTDVAAGASGIACGVIRNNYFQPAMRRLMAHSVAVWESDPEAYSYHPVGYMQISHETMRENVAQIAREQAEIGYPSVFIEGRDECMAYMKRQFHDWQARGITSILHEQKGGYANNKASMRGLAAKARRQGVTILPGARVCGFRRRGDTVCSVITDQGAIETDYVIVAVGPWIKSLWEMLELPRNITIKGRDGTLHTDIRMWTYWLLQEGTINVDPAFQQTNDGRMPPVLHVDTDEPLYSDIDGTCLTDAPWGIYYKPDFHFGGVQGGGMPCRVNRDPDEVRVDPYGPASPEFVVDDAFARWWCSALAFCQKRFEGQYAAYRKEPSGGLGAFTPDSFPVFDVFHENVYVIADSNHGYKMIGVGQLVAGEIIERRSDPILEPFRFSRYIEGRLHPVSNSPFPWS